MLITQTWILNSDPPREIIYDRLCRFKEKCKELGIPNPYSVFEINEADKRWHRLHKNAVPSFLELNNELINDLGIRNQSKSQINLVNVNIKDDDFDF